MLLYFVQCYAHHRSFIEHERGRGYENIKVYVYDVRYLE